MSLSAGTRLGPYEIIAPIGAGGMGEVYKATDTRLGREVAIKVSQEQFSERFEREARAISALNHPHICTLYDVGPNYLVMELVEGETPRGPMPIQDALAVARQIAEALEAAHEKGITHRDLKPANIKVKPDGTVKVLDFGLAKTGAASPMELEHSPTLTITATGAGMILGTAPYMAPEQARGQPVDKRADIWAFGVVLYELLTGRRMFTGESSTDVLAAVVRADPDWSALPTATPEPIRRLLKRCLEKDRKKRLPDIGVARLEIDEATLPDVVAHAPAARRWISIPWFAAAVSLLALAAVAWISLRPRADSQWTGSRLGGSSVAMSPRISPDGRLLAFQAMVDGLTQVAVMKPETGNWTVLTRDRSRGFIINLSWSRDSAKLYFDRWQDAPRGVFSVPVLGGDEQLVLEDAANPQALPDGSLVIQRLNSERRFQLWRFWPASGRLQSFKVALPLIINSTNVRVTPAGDRAVFFGRPLDDSEAPDHLYAMELSSERILRLAPGVSFAVGGFFPLAVGADARSAFVDLPVDDSHRIVSVPLDGTGKFRTVLTLTDQVAYLDTGSDGSLYLDQWDRPVELLSVPPDGNSPERIGTVIPSVDGSGQVLPLPDGRLLANSRTGGLDHLLLMTPGKDAAPFLDTAEETSGPMSFVGQTQVAFMLGPKGSRAITLASLTDRRIARRLDGSKGGPIDSLVSSPDGQTIYYAASGSIWSIPATDGQPQKIRNGDSVTLDPYKRELIVRVTEQQGTRLVRVPLTGGAERSIVLQGEMRVAPIYQASNAVGKDGRILAQVASPASWFWPLGLIDPDSGRVQIIRIGYDADMGGGWTEDGKLVITAIGLRASLWRFRPQQTATTSSR